MSSKWTNNLTFLGASAILGLACYSHLQQREEAKFIQEMWEYAKNGLSALEAERGDAQKVKKLVEDAEKLNMLRKIHTLWAHYQRNHGGSSSNDGDDSGF